MKKGKRRSVSSFKTNSNNKINGTQEDEEEHDKITDGKAKARDRIRDKKPENKNCVGKSMSKNMLLT